MSTKNDYEGLKKVSEGCRISIWRLPGKRFGVLMRMTSDQYIGYVGVDTEKCQMWNSSVQSTYSY